MNISTPIAIPATPILHPITQAVITTVPAFTLTTLDLVIIDDAKRKLVQVRLAPRVPHPLTIWSAEAYTAAGDYTQTQVEARVTELLGSNPGTVVAALLQPPAPPVRPSV